MSEKSRTQIVTAAAALLWRISDGEVFSPSVIRRMATELKATNELFRRGGRGGKNRMTFERASRAVKRHGSIKAAAVALGCHETTVSRALKRGGK